MLRRFFGTEKAMQDGAFDPGLNSVGSRVTIASLQGTLKAEDNRSPENLNITQSLPDLTNNTSSGSVLEGTQGELREEIRINWPKDSLESVNESVCSDPMAGQFQNKPENAYYHSAENLLGVEKSQASSARRVFSLKKSPSKHQQSEDLPKDSQSISNSTSLLSVDLQTSNTLKSETMLNETQQNKGTSKEKAETFGSRTFTELLQYDNRSNPDKSDESKNFKHKKRSSSKSREKRRTLTGLEFLKLPEISKSPVPEADGTQPDRDSQGSALSRLKPEWRSASVKGSGTGKYSEVAGTPSKADNISARTAITHVPISKLDDHLVLALDGLEENSEVQVAKVDASSLSFKPEELASYLELQDTWHFNKASANLNCIAVLLPSSRHSSHGLASLLDQFESVVKKLCIAKGSVAVSRVQGSWPYSRYLLLTSEDLLIMKQKTTTTFKLKKRVTLSNLWFSPNPDQSGEVGGSNLSLSLIVGWPLATNYLFLFAKAAQKMMWITLLERQISVERQKDSQKETVIKITTQDTDYTMTKSLVVKPEEIVSQVVQRCLKELHLIDSDPKHFELCLKSRDNVVPLIGHEVPFYIQQQNLREQDKIPQPDRMAKSFDHFVLRPRKTQQRNGFRRRARNQRLTLVGLFGKKSASAQPDVLQSMPQPKLFGRSLSEVCSDDLPPKPIMDLLQRLYIHGPNTPGIFRKSGNHRDLLELKARLDAGEECNTDGISIHTAASAVKNWLRSLPDCLLLSGLYSQWIEVICISDSEKKNENMKRLVLQLPNHNVLLLRHLICVLHRVSSRAELNHMTSGNLAICLGPTVLWPAGSIDLTSECVSVELVARVTQLLIDDAQQILGEDSLELFKGSAEDIPMESELNFESEDSMGSHELLNTKGDLEKNASLESLDNYSFDDGLDTHSYSAVQSQMSVDSGLAASNPRLNDEPEQKAVVIQIPHDQPRYAKRLLGTKKKVHTKSELSDISEALTVHDAEERPSSKMAGAGNVRQRISRFQASKMHLDDLFSCGENFESSDDDFMQTSISSSENFVEASSYLEDANSFNDGTSHKFEDNSESDENERNDDGLIVSENNTRSLPGPVIVENQIGWSSQKAGVSVRDLQTEVDKPTSTLDMKISKEPSNSGNDWYFMGPEENLQSKLNIRRSYPDKQKAKFEASNKTSVFEVQDKQEKPARNRLGLSSNSLRHVQSVRNESTIPPVKQNSLDAGVHNSTSANSGEGKPVQTAKPQSVKLILNKSDSTPLCLHLTSFEVLENQPSQHIRPSRVSDAHTSANSISFSTDNLGSDSMYRRPSRNRSVPRRLTDVAVNTSEPLLRSSRGVQTDPLHDQNILRPMEKPKRSSLYLSDGEMNDSKHGIECSVSTNQEENRPVLNTGRRFRSDLGNLGGDAIRAILSPSQKNQTERSTTRERSYTFSQQIHPNEQFRSVSKDSDNYESHRQVKRTSVHNRMNSREAVDFSDQLPVMQDSAPVSIEQRIRDRRAVTVVTIGDAVSRSRSCDKKLVRQPTTICIPAKEFPTLDSENHHDNNKGSKTSVSNSESLKNDVARIHSNAFNQTVGNRAVQDYAPRSSRVRPMYAFNTPSAKLELQSRSDSLNNPASLQVQSSVRVHRMDDRGNRTDLQNFGASKNIDSSSIHFHAPRQRSRLSHNSSVDSVSHSGELGHRGSLKHRGEERRDNSRNIDATLNTSLQSVKNSRKDISAFDDSQRRNEAKGPWGPRKPVVASHQFDIGEKVDAYGSALKIRSSPVKSEDSSVTWSVNELKKRFDVAQPNSRFTQQKLIAKRQ